MQRPLRTLRDLCVLCVMALESEHVGVTRILDVERRKVRALHPEAPPPRG